MVKYTNILKKKWEWIFSFWFYGWKLKKYRELWNEIKNEIKTINGGKKGEYGKDFIKIKFDTDDNLPLNEQWKLWRRW